jgi:hypothetical protein
MNRIDLKQSNIKIPNQTPILVTGSHRSGTTWVGKMISLSPKVHYIFEPFNITVCNRTSKYPFKYWQTYVDGLDHPEELLEAIGETLTYSYREPIPKDCAWHFAIRLWLRRWLENCLNRKKRLQPLMKDPIALFSAEVLAEVFAMKVVCMIRHPLSFCSSIKKWEWDFPFDHFLKQPLAIAKFFPEEESRIEQFYSQKQPYVKQAVLLWILFHKVIKSYKANHVDWLFLRHEDIISDPIKYFQKTYDFLDLPLNWKIKEQILLSLQAPLQETNDPCFKERNPNQMLTSWKNRLTQQEIDYILKETGDLRLYFYPEDKVG